jgi:hypothetical protein
MKITQGSGNVYANIGVTQPEAMLAKARLARASAASLLRANSHRAKPQKLSACRSQSYPTSCADNFAG